MKQRSLQQWLAWLETLHPSEIELGLQRVSLVAKKLQVDSLPCPVITVAGTNGKGSTVAALNTFLLAHEKSVGTYTSPHLQRFNERVCINGQEVSDGMLCRAFEEIENHRGEISLTYFEYTTLAALLCFVKAEVDFVILEVGLGGRLDAVNLIDADIAIVTNIALDHQNWLGDNREDIGREKAGIARANRPLLVGEADIPSSVLTIADQLEVKLYRYNQDFSFEQHGDLIHWRCKGADDEIKDFSSRVPNLSYPSVNLALQALQLLNIELDEKKLICEIENLALTGRFQSVLCKGIPLILDVAHNPAAAKNLAGRLAATACEGKTHIVFTMLSDKDATGVLTQLKPIVTGQWLVADLAVPRAKPASELVDILKTTKADNVSQYKDVSEALTQVLSVSNSNDRIVVTGSFYTVAASMEWLERKGDEK